MFWKIVLVLGTLGVLLGLAVTGISAALPIATDGRAGSCDPDRYRSFRARLIVFCFSYRSDLRDQESKA